MYSKRSSQVFPDVCSLPLTAKEVRDVRILLGLSQAQLAARIGVRQISTISDWEQGIKHPSPDMERALRKALKGRLNTAVMRQSGRGTWLRGVPRLDAAAQWGLGQRIGGGQVQE